MKLIAYYLIFLFILISSSCFCQPDLVPPGGFKPIDTVPLLIVNNRLCMKCVVDSADIKKISVYGPYEAKLMYGTLASYGVKIIEARNRRKYRKMEKLK